MKKKIAGFLFGKPTFGVKWLQGWMVVMGAALVVFGVFALIE